MALAFVGFLCSFSGQHIIGKICFHHQQKSANFLINLHLDKFAINGTNVCLTECHVGNICKASVFVCLFKSTSFIKTKHNTFQITETFPLVLSSGIRAKLWRSQMFKLWYSDIFIFQYRDIVFRVYGYLFKIANSAINFFQYQTFSF